MTINVIPRWVQGKPKELKCGQFVVYEDGDSELIGWSCGLSSTKRILKHTTLIEPHELDWLQSMAVGRSLGVLK